MPIQTTEPVQVTAGDLVTWTKSLPAYPASAGWVLTYYLVRAGARITVIAAASGDDHLVSVAAATTAAWAVGSYQWQARVVRGAEIYTVSTGAIEILTNFEAATTGYDARSHARRTLDALNSWINSHDLAVQSYQIAGREMRYIPIGELLKLRSQLTREVAAEEAAQRAAAGLPSKNKINVRFG